MNKPVILTLTLLTMAAPVAAQDHTSHSSQGNAQSSEPADPQARASTPEERTRCEAMMRQMGSNPQHSHAEQKGVIGQTPINREHARCHEILSQQPSR